MADLARRGRIRDYAVAADLLEHYSPADLIGFASRLDPALDRRALTNLARRLDELPDIALTAMRALEPEDVSRLRDRFARWPRDARDIDRQQDARQREQPGLSRGTSDRAATRHEHAEPSQPERQPREHPDTRQPPRAEPARSQPGSDTPATTKPDLFRVPVWQPNPSKQRDTLRRGREREADRDFPEIER